MLFSWWILNVQLDTSCWKIILSADVSLELVWMFKQTSPSGFLSSWDANRSSSIISIDTLLKFSTYSSIRREIKLFFSRESSK